MKQPLEVRAFYFLAALSVCSSCASTPSDYQQRLSSRDGRELYAPKFTEIQSSLALASEGFSPRDPGTWRGMKNAIIAAETLDKEYSDAVKYSSKAFPERESLSTAVNAAKKSAESQSYNAFMSWPLDAPTQFESSYPVNLRINKAWASERAKSISFDGKLDEVVARIGSVSVAPVREAAISSLVSRVQAGDYGNGIEQKIGNATTIAKSLGLGSVPLTFSVHTAGPATDLTNKLLIGGPASAYAIKTISGDTKTKDLKGTLVSFTPTANLTAADLKLNVEKQEGYCKIERVEDSRSRRQVGLKKAPNPEVDRLQTEISNASENLIGLQELSYSYESLIAQKQVRLQDAINRAANTPKYDSTGLNQNGAAMAGLLNAYADSSAQRRINELQSDIRDQNRELIRVNQNINETNANIQRLQIQLARTAPMIDVPDYAPYDYKVEVHSCENKTHYRLSGNGSSLSSSNTSQATSTFKLAFGIDSADPSRKQLLEKYAVKKDLDEFTAKRLEPNLSSLIYAYFTKVLPSGADPAAAAQNSSIATP